MKREGYSCDFCQDDAPWVGFVSLRTVSVGAKPVVRELDLCERHKEMILNPSKAMPRDIKQHFGDGVS